MENSLLYFYHFLLYFYCDFDLKIYQLIYYLYKIKIFNFLYSKIPVFFKFLSFDSINNKKFLKIKNNNSTLLPFDANILFDVSF